MLENAEDHDAIYIYELHYRGLHCQLSPSLGQYGLYEFTARLNGSCELRVNKPPDDRYTRKLIL